MHAVVCPSLYLTTGTVSYSDPTLGMGSVANYTDCSLNTVVMRTCQTDGTWSGAASACESMCMALHHYTVEKVLQAHHT